MALPEIGALRQSKRVPFLPPDRTAFDSERPAAGKAEPDALERAADDSRLTAGRPDSVRTIEAKLWGQIEGALRAPLSRAASAARVLADEVDDAQMPAILGIVDALEHTEGILLDVAEFLRSDLDSCRRAWRRRTSLSRLCERVLDSIQCRYPTQAMKFESDRRVDGNVDPDAIATMITRILVNAIQHAASSPAIRIKVWGFDDQAVVEVWSAGVFPDEVASPLPFEAFGHTRARRPDGGRGLGLGLHLAARTARAHGGRIEIQSDLRNGTTVRVFLPRA